MGRCLGITKGFKRCERPAGRRLFCPAHRIQPRCIIILALIGIGYSYIASHIPLIYNPNKHNRGYVVIQVDHNKQVSEVLVANDSDLEDKVEKAYKRAREQKRTSKGAGNPKIEDKSELLQYLLQSRRSEQRINEYIQRSCEIAAVAYSIGDIKTAYDAVDDILKREPNHLFALNLRGLVNLLWGRLLEAEANFSNVLNLTKAPAKRGYVYNSLGVINYNRGDFKEAEDMLKKYLDISTSLEDKKGMSIAYGNLGVVFHTSGEKRKLKQAESMIIKSLEMAEALQDKRGVAIRNGNLGLIYAAQGNFALAQMMLQKSLKISESLGNKYGMAIQYINLGLIYCNKGRLIKAEEMISRALEINESLGNKKGMAITYSSFGVVYYAKNALVQAEENVSKSLKIYESLVDVRGSAIQCVNLGKIYERQGDFSLARDNWFQAIKLFRQIGMESEVDRVQRMLLDLKEKYDNKT